MRYRVGEPGRIIIARFDEGDDVLKGLEEIAKKEGLKAAVFHLVGGMRAGRFVVGPKEDKLPPEPMWREIEGPTEVTGMGTIFPDEEGAPRVHFHGAYARGDSVRAGCLRADSKAFLVLEAVIIEIKGVDSRRELDPKSGMRLLRV